jgi:hypothetical protein
MNWKHLFWIIPLSLIIGGWLGLIFFNSLLDFTGINISAKCVEKLQDSYLAWEEKTDYSNATRIFYNGQYCYMWLGKIICPQRNISNLTIGSD